MNITIIIPTHRREKNLDLLLSSISPKGLKEKVEVILVGNTNEDDSYVFSLKSKYGEKLKVKSFISEKKGVNCARNMGVQKSSKESSWFLFLDDDCILDSPLASYFTSLKSQLEKTPEISFLGGHYKLPEGSHYYSKAYHIMTTNWHLRGQFLNMLNWHLYGGLLFCRKDLFLTESFNEDIIFGGAESEFILRMISKGRKSLASPNLSLYHSSDIKKKDLISKAKKQKNTMYKNRLFFDPLYKVPIHIDYKEYLINYYAKNNREKWKIYEALDIYEKNFNH